MDRVRDLLQWPCAPLFSWMGALAVLVVIWLLAGQIGVRGAEERRMHLETAWSQARQRVMQHREARKARRDVSQVWAMLPAERDFAPLALGLSEEAKQDGVILPALSYKTEITPVANTSKGILHGAMSGRYEDLRRFIYDIETANEPLFIEDLELANSSSAQGPQLTFNVKIGTYLRGDTGKPPQGEFK